MTTISLAVLGTYGVYKASLNEVSKLQKALQQVNQQSASGVVADYYSGNARVARESLNTKVERQDLQQLKDNINVVEDRVTKAQTTVNELAGILREFKTRLKGFVNPGQPDLGFQQFCKNAMMQVQNALNVRDVSGNAIFGGTEFTDNPFDASLTPIPDLLSPVSTAPFQGTSTSITARIGPYSTQPVNFTDGQEAYLQIFYVLQIGANYTPDYVAGSTNMQMLEKAQNAADDAERKLAIQLEKMKALHNQLLTSRDQINDQVEMLTERQKQLDGVDIIEAYILKLQLQEQLLLTTAGLKSTQENTLKVINQLL
jgi:flagellin-like hook-associated protein FlgL